MSGIVLALVFGAASALGQQGAHATVVPQASRQDAPAFQLADNSGTNKQVTDYRGKVVLLNFWATECGGCKLEIPWLIELESAHKSDNFTVVGVSMDTSYEGSKSADEAWSKVKPFVVNNKLNYPVLMGEATLITSYKLGAVPATYLIDKQGRIAATYSGVIDKTDVDSNIDKLLAEP
ncbi:MAG: TlpA disulfide reductase family protein [Terracidiphilus sp.]|jgi:peroxiredoxin